MNHSFYTAAVGAQQQMNNLNIQGNNIANVNTQGYKAQKSRFVSLFRQQLESIDAGQQQYGTGARLLMTSTDHAQGAPMQTGRKHDYMIDGDGYFAVVDMTTREVTFTRNGAFEITFYQRFTGMMDEYGEPVFEDVAALTDGEGRFVLSRMGNIINVTDPNVPQDVGIFDYANYDGMLHQDGTDFLPTDKNGNLYMGTGRLMNGALEGSNVDLGETMTKVIEAQRAYSMALKMLQTSDEIEQTINNLR